jgi:hypothetical protein
MKIKLDIKIKSQWWNLKKKKINSTKDSRLNALQSKEWRPNLIQ